MKRLVVIALILVGIGGAAFGLHYWDTQLRFYRYADWTKVHYLMNKDAFDRLSEQLSEDPLIESVTYYPPGSLKPEMAEPRQLDDPLEQAELDKLVEDIQAQRSRYEPILADLKFPGPISFHTNENHPRLIESFGPSGQAGNVLTQSWLIHADGVDTYKVPCPSNPLDHPTGDCAERLGGDWWQRYSWFTWVPEQ
jgi:hypothetical protein